MSLILTNNTGLNILFCTILDEVIGNYIHNHGEFSVTELSRHPASVILYRRCILNNEFDIVCDYIDFVPALQGIVWDKFTKDVIRKKNKTLLETYRGKGRPRKKDYNLSKITLCTRIKIDTDFGVKLTGELDYLLNESCIHDMKVISKQTFLQHMIRYEEQLNLYRYLRLKKGYPVDCLNLDIIIKDKKKYDTEIPNIMFTHSIKMWDINDTERFIHRKLKSLIEYENKTTEELIEIAKKDRFSQEIKGWAVKKKGNQNNTKIIKIQNGNEEGARIEAENYTTLMNKKSSGYYSYPIIKTIENYDFNVLRSILN